MTFSPLRFTVIGLGGYGLVHIRAIRWLSRLGLGRLSGVVALDSDRQARPEMVRDLEGEGVTLYRTVDAFLAEGICATDVLTVPIGIHQHVPISIAALEAGLHVYCEKPVAATVQEVDRLIVSRRSADRLVAIGFQHMYGDSIRQLKQRIVTGRLGRVHTVSLVCGWPRSRQYYTRNEWAGRMKLGPEWILDTPANNAHAHYLLNALFLCSPEPGTTAMPRYLRAELYRAYAIESADTVQLRITTDSGADLHVLLTHANGKEFGPFMDLVCDNGRAYWQTDDGKAYIRYADGATEEFHNAVHPEWRYEGFRDLVEAIGERRQPLCTPELARPLTVAVNAMHESCPKVLPIPDAFVDEAEDWELFPPNTKGTFRRIRDIDAHLRIAQMERESFSGLGLPWAKEVRPSSLHIDSYLHFPQFQSETIFLPTAG